MPAHHRHRDVETPPEQRRQGHDVVEHGPSGRGARCLDDPPPVLAVLHVGDLEEISGLDPNPLDRDRVEPRHGGAREGGEDERAAAHTTTVCRGAGRAWEASPHGAGGRHIRWGECPRRLPACQRAPTPRTTGFAISPWRAVVSTALRTSGPVPRSSQTCSVTLRRGSSSFAVSDCACGPEPTALTTSPSTCAARPRRTE